MLQKTFTSNTMVNTKEEEDDGGPAYTKRKVCL